MMKVTTKYSIEDCLFMANYANKRNYSKMSSWVKFYYYYIFVNGFALPAILFFLDYVGAGLIAFLINFIILILLKDKINRESYKSYYRDFFPGDEFREFEVELSDDGIRTKSFDWETFQIWDSVKEIVETKDTIYFFTRGNGIPITKNSFEFEPQMEEFLIFAKARIPQHYLK